MKRSSEPFKWWAENERQWVVTRQSIQNWITILVGFQSREVKVSLSFFRFKTMKCLEQLISVRSCCNVYTSRGNDCFWLASFFCCQKKSNNWNLVSLLSFAEIVISGLILRLKAMELAEMRTSKPHWVEKIVQNMWELKRSWWIRRRHRLRQRNAWSSWRWFETDSEEDNDDLKLQLYEVSLTKQFL